MNREEILLNSIWVEGKLKLYSEFFQEEVRIDLFTSEKSLRYTDHIISDKLVQTVNDFLSFEVSEKELMAKLLYKHCLDCCEQISYGVEVKEGETETEANLREFGVSTEQDAFVKARIDHAVIEEDVVRKNRFVRLIFYPEWESEHGCELILKNGKLLDFVGEAQTYLAPFDD